MEYRLYTLADITNTGQFKTGTGRELEKNQEQNFKTILQTIGLRSNVIYSRPPKLLTGFGIDYGFEMKDEVNIWCFDFSTERDDIWLENGDQLALLQVDFELVPFITELTESIALQPAVFQPLGEGRNIVFEVLT